MPNSKNLIQSLYNTLYKRLFQSTTNLVNVIGVISLISILMVGSLLLQFNSNSITKTALAASPNVNIDKKFIVGGVEKDNLVGVDAVASGATITERIYYNNTGDTDGLNAQITSQLPTGFIVQSLKNCLDPSNTQSNSDDTCSSNLPTSLVNGSNQLNVSPVAGLYDAAQAYTAGTVSGTASTADKGVLEIGKKRYLNQYVCRYFNPTTGVNQDYFHVNPFSNTGTPGFNTGTTGASYCNSANPVNGQNPRAVANAGGYTSIGTEVQNTEDLLDATRARGYIEVTMKAPSPTSSTNYLQNSTITGSNFGSATDSGTITVSASPTAITQSNVSNSSNCITSLSVTVPNTYNCTFPLVGNGDNNYFISASPIKASTGTDNTTTAILSGSVSDDCTITGNGTVSAALNCNNIKSSGSNAGVKNVIMTIAGLGATDVGDVIMAFASSTLNLKANLGGAYNTATSLMNTALNTSGIIPSSQPYNVAPFSYAGSETISGALGSSVVDWVLIEVRDSTRTTVIERKAGLLKSDGTIVNPSTQSGGVLLTTISATANYNIIVRHRNHLAISTSTAIILTSGSTVAIDYTTNTNVLASNQSLLAPGVYGMKKGNTNGDSSIDATDRVQTRTGAESFGIYTNRDLNLDGYINATDRNISRLEAEASDGV